MMNKTTNELKTIARENKPFHTLAIEASERGYFIGVAALNRSDLYNQAKEELLRRGEG
jgi:hypothetical protein